MAVPILTQTGDTTFELLHCGYEVRTVTIGVGAAKRESEEIDFRKFTRLAFQMPAAWDAGTITIKGSAVSGATKQSIITAAGTALEAITVAVNNIYIVDPLNLSGISFLSLTSSVDQTADRVITLLLKR